MIVSIHQPNFFPYEGVLEKIRSSDRFVVLAHAQFSPGDYHNRFRLDGRWMTMSVHRSLESLIRKKYVRPLEDWNRIKRRIPEYASILSEFDSCINESLVETNTAIIERICDLLDIRTEVVVDFPTTKVGTGRLVELCEYYGADVYLSGVSGPKYLDFDVFHRTSIQVVVQDPGSAFGRGAVKVLEEAMSDV